MLSNVVIVTFAVVRFSGSLIRRFQVRNRIDSSDAGVASVALLDVLALVLLVCRQSHVALVARPSRNHTLSDGVLLGRGRGGWWREVEASGAIDGHTTRGS